MINDALRRLTAMSLSVLAHVGVAAVLIRCAVGPPEPLLPVTVIEPDAHPALPQPERTPTVIDQLLPTPRARPQPLRLSVIEDPTLTSPDARDPKKPTEKEQDAAQDKQPKDPSRAEQVRAEQEPKKEALKEPTPKKEEPKKEEPVEVEEEQQAKKSRKGGEGSGAGWQRFARTEQPTTPGEAGAHIGDRNVQAQDQYAPTNVDRSLGKTGEDTRLLEESTGIAQAEPKPGVADATGIEAPQRTGERPGPEGIVGSPQPFIPLTPATLAISAAMVEPTPDPNGVAAAELSRAGQEGNAGQAGGPPGTQTYDGFWEKAGVGATDEPPPAADVHTVAWSSLTVIDGPEAESASAGTRDTPLGRWNTLVDDTMRQRWFWPTELRLMEIGGVVVISFTVKRNGKVEDLYVTRSCGYPDLDMAARAIVPSQVPPLPPGIRQVQMRYTIRYVVPEQQ